MTSQPNSVILLDTVEKEQPKGKAQRQERVNTHLFSEVRDDSGNVAWGNRCPSRGKAHEEAQKLPVETWAGRSNNPVALAIGEALRNAGERVLRVVCYLGEIVVEVEGKPRKILFLTFHTSRKYTASTPNEVEAVQNQFEKTATMEPMSFKLRFREV